MKVVIPLPEHDPNNPYATPLAVSYVNGRISKISIEYPLHTKEYIAKPSDIRRAMGLPYEAPKKYNKAQEECIEQWGEYPEALAGPNSIKQFLNEFNAIDPAPDPETYSVWLISFPSESHIFGGASKEVVNAWLRQRMKETLAHLNYIKEYKDGEYLVTASNVRYEVRKEE